MDITKIQKWGNSLAVRLPKSITKNLHFKEGSTVFITQDNLSVRIKEAKNQGRTSREWKAFLIPTKKKKGQSISSNVDSIVYGKHS